MEETAAQGSPNRQEARRRRAPDVPAEILAACRAGDRDAFEALFRRTEDYVYSVALHTVGDEARAADVTQEVFLKLLRGIRRFEARARFSTWLYRVTVNAALDHARAVRPAVPVEEVEAMDATELRSPEGLSPEAGLIRRRTASGVRRAMGRLPATLRAPLALRYLAGLSYREIGETLGLPGGTVASRLSRALEALEQELRTMDQGRSE